MEEEVKMALSLTLPGGGAGKGCSSKATPC